MKAVYYSEVGELSKVMHYGELPVPQPGPNEARVKVHAVGLNPVDYKLVGKPAAVYPVVYGLDVAGVVDALGEGVANVKVGERVHFFANLLKQYGGFAEYSITDAETLIPLPDDVSFVDAAALPTAAWTAYQALHYRLHLHKGQTIVVTAAAGGVGGFAVQFAKLAGLKVIGTCSTKNKDFVLSLGADHVIDYTTENIPQRVKELTNGIGAEGWIDLVDSNSATEGLSTLAFGGTLVACVGTPDITKVPMFPRALTLSHVFLGQGYGAHRAAQLELKEIGERVLDLLIQKKLNTLVGEVIELKDVPDALHRLKERHVRGKIVAKLH